MRVLICAENIFSEIGGGQSFYTDLVRAYPDHQYYYFSSDPKKEANVPVHVSAIHIKNDYRDMEGALSIDGFFIDGYNIELKKYDLLYMLDLASSVAGLSFDIVDIPDYIGYATALPSALKRLGVSFDKVAVSLHGTLTDGVTDNWADVFSMEEIDHMRNLEDRLLQGADICYAISPRYLAQRQAQTGCKGRILDLTHLIPFPTFKALRDQAADVGASRGVAEAQLAPALAFIGRQEKWKGPDLFIDMAAGLPRSASSATLLIGPETRFRDVSSGDQLLQLARNRSLSFEHRIYARSELWQMLARSRLAAVFPSRHDTLNLAALETLLTGTPAVISTAAGICDFLDEAFPGLPFARMDPEDLAGAKRTTLDVLENYDAHRAALIAYLDRHEARSTGESLDAIYAEGDQPADHARLYDPFASVLDHLVRGAVEVARTRSRDALGKKLHDMLGDKMSEGEVQNARHRFTHALDQAYELRRYEAELDEILTKQPFLSDEQMGRVWAHLEPFCYSVNRVPVYRLLARLEKARGNLLLYATYQIRCMRLSGRSDPETLEEVAGILRDHNFAEEAEAACWMYGENFAHQAAARYLKAMPHRFLTVPSNDIERVLDERTIDIPKISIIVSLYRAASKLPVFFDGLSRLTETTRNMTEIVLVDSHSPDNTFDVVQDLIVKCRAEHWNVSIYYLRTSVRETIQRAWNRGIGAAKGAYLSFLGVDEMNRSDAFDMMAEYLDRNPNIDWVQGTALVTEVNERGSYVRDVMLYDRTFETDYMNVFDTCYIGYVGALYRKSIHERVGYYDDRFRGAGDSEFKNRALPHINVVTLPVCLGYFLNYPEERTTASPMAEIEDIRAWYLYRSPAGAEVIFGDTQKEHILTVLQSCMQYRKSYMKEISTDLELASSIMQFIDRTGHPLHVQLFAQGSIIRRARDIYCVVDSLSDIARHFTEVSFVYEMSSAIERAIFNLASAQRDLDITGLPARLSFFNDNRSHQHHYIWRSRAQSLLINIEDPFVELAGPQDFAEALSACGATDQAVDFERAWAANDLNQLKRLQVETRLDIALEWNDQSAIPDLVRSFITELGDRYSLVVIGARPPLRHSRSRIYFTGPVDRSGPAVFAARCIVVRHDPAHPSLTVAKLSRAIMSGLPLVADEASVRELGAILPDLDLSAIETVNALPAAFARAAALADGAPEDADRRAALHALANALAAHPRVIMFGKRVAHNVPLLHFAGDIFRLNRTIRELYEQNGMTGCLAFLEKIDAVEQYKATLIINSLFYSKSAPILKTNQPIFKQIKSEQSINMAGHVMNL